MSGTAPAARSGEGSDNVTSGRHGRVLHVIRASVVAGAERHLISLVRGLRQVGWASDVLVLTPDMAAMAPYADMLRAVHANVTVRHMGRDASPRLVSAIRRRAASDGYAVLHSHLVHADWHVAAGAAGWPGSVVTSKHNADPFRRRRLFAAAERLSLRRADAVIAISRSLADFTERFSHVRPTIVHYGLEPGPEPERSVPDEPVLLAVGRLERQKGFDVLIDAVALASPMRLLIAGEGSERDRLAAQIAGRGLDERVTLLGWRDDATDLLADATALVHPARWEGFGLVLLEAMRAGKPVIATRIGAIPEVVEHGLTGLLVAPDDPRALAQAIGTVARDAGQARRLGDAGRRRLVDRFTPAAMADATAAVYAAAVDRRARTR